MSRTRGLERLWAPWRVEYIARATSETPDPRRTAAGAGRRRASRRDAECLFCEVGKPGRDRENLVLARGPETLLMLNRYPYSPAHLMVAVRRHVARFSDLTARERDELLGMTALAERALEAEYRPHGMNAGANLGRVAGAGYPGHLHLHLVPRWNGDTNFMPVIGETRVLPESLARTWSRLRAALRALDRPARRGTRRG